MTAVDRALELLADTVELPALAIVRDGVPVPADQLRDSAGLLELLTRYRRALADLAAEVLSSECGSCGGVGVTLAPGTTVCADAGACEQRFRARQ